MSVDSAKIEVSVITVCRNSAATIAGTIESVLAQKDASVEYLVVDGASTDGTQEIVRSFQRVDRLVSEPDRGIADAFNKGIQLADGAIIGLINSDDQLSPDAIAFVRKCFAENPEIDVIHGDILLFAGDRCIKRVKPSGKWWYPWRLVLFNHPATFVRREIYEKYGMFDIGYKIGMDAEIFLRWVSSGVKIGYYPKIIANMQAGGASGKMAVTGYLEVCRAAIRYGFSPFLAYLQLFGKVTIWVVLQLLAKFSVMKKASQSIKAAL